MDRKARVAAGGEPLVSALRKTQLCQFWAVGKCQKHAACPFAHGTDDLRTSPNFSRTSLCVSVKLGVRCGRPNCRFAHDPQELRVEPIVIKTKICKYFPQCTAGDECRFIHPENGDSEAKPNDLYQSNKIPSGKAAHAKLDQAEMAEKFAQEAVGQAEMSVKKAENDLAAAKELLQKKQMDLEAKQAIVAEMKLAVAAKRMQWGSRGSSASDGSCSFPSQGASSSSHNATGSVFAPPQSYVSAPTSEPPAGDPIAAEHRFSETQRQGVPPNESSANCIMCKQLADGTKCICCRFNVACTAKNSFLSFKTVRTSESDDDRPAQRRSRSAGGQQ